MTYTAKPPTDITEKRGGYGELTPEEIATLLESGPGDVLLTEGDPQDPETWAVEGYPDGNPKTTLGVKKAPMHLVPVVPIAYEAGVFALGAKKYGPYNWREQGVSASVYYSAALRHLAAWWDGETIDPESGQPHLAHVRACMAILLDAGEIGMLNDDRPPAGGAAAVLAALDGSLKAA